MLDFAALPPEVNSARMYAGPGSGPMMAAATAWGGLAGQLELFAAGYSSELTTVQGQLWSGPASDAMFTAAAPYVAWANATAAQAEQAASQARAAAAAYEAAFAMTVPPSVVEANRTLLMALIATNFLGQNTPAIAATEAHYGEMWAQDAAAMYGYAGSSLPAVATLTPFKAPPKTTNPAGQSAQSVAASHAASSAATQTSQSVVTHALSTASPPAHSLSTSPTAAPPPSTSASGSSGYFYVNSWQTLETLYNDYYKAIPQPAYNIFGVTTGDATGLSGGFGLFGSHLSTPSTTPFLFGKSPFPPLFSSPFGGAGAAGGPALAGWGNAVSVGRLSVPQSWSATTAAAKTGYVAQSPEPQVAAGQPAVKLASSSAPAAEQLSPPLAPMGGSERRHGGNAVFRMQERRWRMPRPTVGG